MPPLVPNYQEGEESFRSNIHVQWFESLKSSLRTFETSLNNRWTNVRLFFAHFVASCSSRRNLENFNLNEQNSRSLQIALPPLPARITKKERRRIDDSIAQTSGSCSSATSVRNFELVSLSVKVFACTERRKKTMALEGLGTYLPSVLRRSGHSHVTRELSSLPIANVFHGNPKSRASIRAPRGLFYRLENWNSNPETSVTPKTFPMGTISILSILEKKKKKWQLHLLVV